MSGWGESWWEKSQTNQAGENLLGKQNDDLGKRCCHR
jgi:hypothetical protein